MDQLYSDLILISIIVLMFVPSPIITQIHLIFVLIFIIAIGVEAIRIWWHFIPSNFENTT